MVMEQVFIAALDCARHDLAIECLQALNVQFPKSSRVQKLQALRQEALGNHAEANFLYDKLLEIDETNAVTLCFGNLQLT
jgi:tetratricopeptide (TPR) repeat protein